MPHKILIVDDDPSVLEALRVIFEDDYEVVAAASGPEAIAASREHSDIAAVVLDIRMARMDGFETASRLREQAPHIPIIFHTAYPGDYSERQVESDWHPFDYIRKTEGVVRLTRSVRNAVEMHRLKSRSGGLVESAKEDFGLVGQSHAMRRVYQAIRQIGPSDSKVMIIGPTGTGKELVARALHKCSKRSHGALGIFNCNHKSPDLVESELFGHVRGAFTGAVDDRVGLFEYADGGTAFLDEIGDLDITTQAKLLRALETGEIQRLGSPEVQKVDVRVICATHCDLAELVEQNRFRKDLYYRLKGVTITMTALKDRPEDIPDLVDYFLEQHCMRNGIALKVFEPAARELFVQFDWPGNVRQLKDTVQSLVDLSASYYITRKEAEAYLRLQPSPPSGATDFQQQVLAFRRSLIVAALDHSDGNISAAARELGLDRSNLRKMIEDLGIAGD